METGRGRTGSRIDTSQTRFRHQLSSWETPGSAPHSPSTSRPAGGMHPHRLVSSRCLFSLPAAVLWVFGAEEKSQYRPKYSAVSFLCLLSPALSAPSCGPLSPCLSWHTYLSLSQITCSSRAANREQVLPFHTYAQTRGERVDTFTQTSASPSAGPLPGVFSHTQQSH